METPSLKAVLDASLAGAELAKMNVGYIPTNHPQPKDAIEKFMRVREVNQQAKSGNEASVGVTQVPPSYPPSVRMVDDLVPMSISQMRLQDHHRGRKVTLRVMTPQDTINAIMAIVEDEQGTPTLLQLYHQPKPTTTDPIEMLHVDVVLIVKEPFFKATGGGTYSIRADHISDVIWLRHGDPRIPTKWRGRRSEGQSSTVMREQGNTALRKKHWREAEKLYTQAIHVATTPEEQQLANLNLAFANLGLGRPEKALESARRVVSVETPPEKGLYREAKALYELGRFAESLEKWNNLINRYPGNKDAIKQLTRVQERIQESQTGNYNFASMYEQAQASPPVIDCATYRVPVVVRETDSCGKGLFTTKDVKAGDLLLCEKAFGYCFADADDPIGRAHLSILIKMDTKRAKVGGHAQLLTDMIHKLYYSPQTSEAFKLLHHGDYKPVSVSNVDGHPVVDTFLVARIISLNCFESFRFTDGSRLFAPTDKSTQGEKDGTCGVYVLASRINHACLANCRRSFIGDMIILRACQDLPAGTELRFEYQPPEATYEETQKKLSTSWGFTCSCQLCEEAKLLSKTVLSRRQALLGDIDEALQDAKGFSQILNKINRLFAAIDKTYSKAPGTVKSELAHRYFAWSLRLLLVQRLRDGTTQMIKGLEALGFEIKTESGVSSGGGAQFEITRWGRAEEDVFWALQRLYEVYEVMAPALCPKLEQYARTVYRICTGTERNFEAEFSQPAMKPA